MNGVVGHADIMIQLAEALPPVSLFVGPRSVGKTKAALDLASAHSAEVIHVQKPTMEDVRDLARRAQMGSQERLQVILLHLTAHPVTETLMNVLLKSLEEHPDTTRFILISEQMPPTTVSSRSEVFRFSLLTEQEVETILSRRNFSPSEAKRLAGLSRGQVMNALRAAGSAADKIPVLQALRTLRERDEDGLSEQARRWTDDHTQLLATAAHEILTERWRVFQAAEVEGTSRKIAMQILTALRQDIRPRLVIHSSLMKILRENR